MAQWGNTDDAANSVLWGVSQVKKTANSTTQANFFDNTTPSAFITNQIVGQFGVDPTEIAVAKGNIAFTYVTSGGSGYTSNSTVTLTNANGTTNTTAVTLSYGSTGTNAGRVTALNIVQPGSDYVVAPTAAIAAPAAINIVANTTGFSNTTDLILITSANSKWQANDRLYYAVPAGNTAIAPLTGNTYYWVSFANTTGIKLSLTKGGANIDITDARGSVAAETHTIKGDTATGYVTVNGAKNKGVAHAGWVVRTEGTGGRAGRVQYETLVAMSSISTDASDDTALPE